MLKSFRCGTNAVFLFACYTVSTSMQDCLFSSLLCIIEESVLIVKECHVVDGVLCSGTALPCVLNAQN